MVLLVRVDMRWVRSSHVAIVFLLPPYVMARGAVRIEVDSLANDERNGLRARCVFM
jgi:hypothetical protein